MPPVPPTTIATLLLLAAAAIAIRQRDATWLLDAAFVALYARYPLPATLALVVAQAVVRRVPTLAREVAVLLRVEEPAGWTLHALLFVLPGLRAYATSGPAPVAPATGQTTALELPIMPVWEWMRWANDDDTAPMLGVVGPSGAGKTTLVLAAIGRRQGELVIVTPKSAETDPWGGFPAIRMRVDLASGQADFSPLANAVRQAHHEMLRRNAEGGIAQEQPLTLVIDEYTTLVAERPEIRPLVIQLWTMGRSSKVRVIVIAPEVSVKAWGIEGRGDVRENLVFIRLVPDRSASMFRIDGQARPVAPRRLDTRPVRQLAAQAQLAHRVWSGLSAVCLPSVRPSVAVEAPNAPPATQADGRTNDHQAKIALLAELRPRMSRAEARTYLATRGITFENSDWTEAGGLSALSAAS